MSFFESKALVKGNYLTLEQAKAFIKEYRDWYNKEGWRDDSRELLNDFRLDEFIEEAYKHNVLISAMALRDFIDKVWKEENGWGFYWTPAGCEWLTHYNRNAIQSLCKKGEIDCYYMFCYHISFDGVMQLIERREKMYVKSPNKREEERLHWY